MEIVILQKFDKHFDQIKNFCQEAIKDCKNLTTKENMDYITWKENPSSLMNRLYIKKSFLMLILLYDKNCLVGLSGIEPYNKEIALIGRRLFILKKYRKGGSFHNFMLEPQINFIRKYGFKLGIITINEYKKSIVKIIERSTHNKAPGFIAPLPKYSDFIILDKPIEFNHVKQYILAVYTSKKYKKEKILERWCNDLQKSRK